MNKYVPDPAFTKAVLSGLTSSLPFLAKLAVKAIPNSLKEPVIAAALTRVLPLSLGAIAMTRNDGTRMPLTSHGELTQEVKTGLVKRIALWLVPDEVTEITKALNSEVVRLAQGGYAEESWKLEVEKSEIILVVLNTSLIKRSADTVADIFLGSFESLKGFKDKLMQRFSAA